MDRVSLLRGLAPFLSGLFALPFFLLVHATALTEALLFDLDLKSLLWAAFVLLFGLSAPEDDRNFLGGFQKASFAVPIKLLTHITYLDRYVCRWSVESGSGERHQSKQPTESSGPSLSRSLPLTL